jgi:hypothetical protein
MKAIKLSFLLSLVLLGACKKEEPQPTPPEPQPSSVNVMKTFAISGFSQTDGGLGLYINGSEVLGGPVYYPGFPGCETWTLVKNQVYQIKCNVGGSEVYNGEIKFDESHELVVVSPNSVGNGATIEEMVYGGSYPRVLISQ